MKALRLSARAMYRSIAALSFLAFAGMRERAPPRVGGHSSPIFFSVQSSLCTQVDVCATWHLRPGFLQNQSGFTIFVGSWLFVCCCEEAVYGDVARSAARASRLPTLLSVQSPLCRQTDSCATLHLSPGFLQNHSRSTPATFCGVATKEPKKLALPAFFGRSFVI